MSRDGPFPIRHEGRGGRKKGRAISRFDLYEKKKKGEKVSIKGGNKPGKVSPAIKPGTRERGGEGGRGVANVSISFHGVKKRKEHENGWHNNPNGSSKSTLPSVQVCCDRGENPFVLHNRKARGE